MYTNLINFGNPITQIKAAPNQPFLATCDSDSRMKIYKTTKKLPINLELSQTKTQIGYIAFSQQGKFAASEDCCVKLWTVGSSSADTTPMQYTFPKQAKCISFADGDDYMATGHKDGKVRLWNLNAR